METNFNNESKSRKWRRPFFIGLILLGTLAYVAVLGSVILRFAYSPDSLTPLAYVLLVAGIAALLISMLVYFVYSRRGLIFNLRELSAVSTAMAIGYTLCLCLSLLSVYLMPIAVTAFLIAPIARRRDAFVCSLATVIMVTWTMLIGINGGIDVALADLLPMFLVGILSGTLASYTVSTDTNRLSYVVKGVVIGAGGVAVFFLFFLVRWQLMDFVFDLPYMAIALAVQALTGLALQPVIERVFNLVTNSRLVELADRNSPLIKRLMNEALGTFSHSMSVANFAEMCAVAIGENPYLARACAYYHDVGKLANPMYFKENQAGQANPHDDLLPEVSAEIIRGHTTEGLKLCRRYRIPDEVSHVTVQHHGTLSIPVFYNKAQKLTDGEVDPYEYSYHGITPVTKIAAIIMICDSGEAAIRAMDNPTGERVDKLLKSLIDSRIAAGQFDNCDITLRDLNTVRRTIVESFGGVYHQRLKYPDGK
ncbi:MAG: HDIG domain-containing protein [Clostridia bacterium]|nr:HDIG domain-containing protein [Clostridia bacterium]